MKALLSFCVYTIFLLYCWPACAQLHNAANIKAKTGTFYFAFGTHRSFYSTSDITFRSHAGMPFHFTLYNVRAKDDGGLNFNTGAPQYNYELGYYNKEKKWGVVFNFDHVKYFIRQYQRVEMQGSINNRYFDKDTLITPVFVQLEHSDGGNYALLKWVHWKPLLDKDEREVLHLVMKGGAGPVIPKTRSTIMGRHRDDRYIIAGYVVALETGLRYSFSRLLFTEATAKGAYASYSHFLIADGKGSQRWLSLHLSLLLGVQLTR